MKEIKILIIVLCFVIFQSCNHKTQDNKKNIFSDLREYSLIIKSKDVDNISKICTKQGLNKLLEWSDSLKNDEIVNSIFNTFEAKNIVFTQPKPNTFCLETEPFKNKSYGEGTGEITLILVKGKLKIDYYNGGIAL